MAISGTWADRYAGAQSYTGARRWGTGVNPIHAVRDNPGRVTGAKTTLYPLGDISDAPPESLLGPDDFVGADWDGEQPYPDESFRYQETYPRWNERTQDFRGESNSDAMGEQPPWGVYNDSNPIDGFPLPGPTGGMDPDLDVHHGENTERQHAIAAPTRGVSGGWLNKARGEVARPEAQAVGDPATQWAVNTAQVQGQGLKSSSNERAIARGTDAPREPVQSRTAGMVVREFARSFGMGGGPGTADMQPYQQTAGLKRPFVARHPALPPAEEHYWNEMEGRVPLQRTVPPDPYQGDPETAGQTGGTDAIYDYGGADDGGDVDWGYF
jgi:hypothetical protein